MEGFTYIFVLALFQVMLYAELDSASNGAISRWGHRWKTWWFTQNIDFFSDFLLVFIVTIRYITFDASNKNDCAEFSTNIQANPSKKKFEPSAYFTYVIISQPNRTLYIIVSSLLFFPSFDSFHLLRKKPILSLEKRKEKDKQETRKEKNWREIYTYDVT